MSLSYLLAFSSVQLFKQFECLLMVTCLFFMPLDLKYLLDKKVDNNLVFLSEIVNYDLEAPILLGHVNFLVSLWNFRLSHYFCIPLFCSTCYLKKLYRVMKMANEDPSFLTLTVIFVVIIITVIYMFKCLLYLLDFLFLINSNILF